MDLPYTFIYIIVALCICCDLHRSVSAESPQLIGTRLSFETRQLLGTEVEFAVAELEFDQELHVEEGVLCGGAEEPCPDLSCRPCDWTSMEELEKMGGECISPDCCAPGGFDSWDSILEAIPALKDKWCNPQEDFTALSFGERTEEVYELQRGQSKYFRFFVPEEMYCRPILLRLLSEYGSTQMVISPIMPTTATVTKDSEGDTETYSFRGLIAENIYNFGRDSLVICPRVDNPLYTAGTFGVEVYALTVPAAFTVELIAGEPYPLQPPASSFTCADVKNTMLPPQVANASRICLDDTISQSVDIDGELFEKSTSVLIPLPPGCHRVTLTLSVYRSFRGAEAFEQPSTVEETLDILSVPQIDTDLACFSSDPESVATLNNGVLVSHKNGNDLILMNVCLDEDTVLYCVLEPWRRGPLSLIASTVALPFRSRMASLPPSSLTMRLPMAVRVEFSEGHRYPCAGWEGCFDYIVYPTSDPMHLWPPPSFLEDQTWQGIYSGQFPPNEYFAATNVTAQPNKLIIVSILRLNSEVLLEKEQYLKSGGILLPQVTSSTGEMVALPYNSPTNGGQAMKIIPNIATSSLERREVNLQELCTLEQLKVVADVVKERAARSLVQTSIAALMGDQYAVGLYQAGAVWDACLQTALSPVPSYTDNATLFYRYDCIFGEDEPEWAKDPCCNPALLPTACCASHDIYTELSIYEGDAADTSTCNVPQCAAVSYDELAVSYTNIDSIALGCGIDFKEQERLADSITMREVERVLLFCLRTTGIGEQYNGTRCEHDEDCAALSSTCDLLSQRCILPPVAELESQYMQCFIERMSSFTEYYLRQVVLGGISSLEAPRNGEQFFRLLRDSASSPDCVNPVNVFDVEKRERFSMVDLNAIDINPGCVGDEYMCAYSHCPESYDCLGRFCRVEGDARGCSFHLDYVRGIQPSREEGCPAAEECNVVGTDAARCQRGEYVCAFCRGAASDGTLGSDCVAFPELTTQEECESAVICELPGGKVTIASSEKHCREMNGHCNVACKGFSCKSHNAQETVCSAHNIQNAMECGSLNQELAGSSENVSWVNEEICVAQYASKSLDGCSQLAQQYPLAGFQWNACEGLTELGCLLNSPQTRYMQCFQDIWRECTSEAECVAARGECSDRYYISSVKPDPNVPERLEVREGKCISSSFVWNLFSAILSCTGYYPDYTFFNSQLLYTLYPTGCLEIPFEVVGNTQDTPDTCPDFLRVDSAATDRKVDVWQTFLTSAETKEECLAHTTGRYGCDLTEGSARYPFNSSFIRDSANIERVHSEWLDEGACSCRGGISKEVWKWKPSRWLGGTPRTAQWIQTKTTQRYSWEEGALSFFTLENWLRESSVNYISAPLKSSIICKSNFLNEPMLTISCDCNSGGSSGSCFEDIVVEVLSAVVTACANETTECKSPNSLMVFSPTSLSEQCLELVVFVVHRKAISAPQTTASANLQFARKQDVDDSIVKNDQNAVVGVLLGDGIVIASGEATEAEEITRLQEVKVCLLIAEEEWAVDKYPTPDFGIASGSYSFVRPLYVNITSVSEVEGNTFWCVQFSAEMLREAVQEIEALSGGDGKHGSKGKVLRFFPISRYSDAQDRRIALYDTEDLTLMRVLLAFYAVGLACTLFFLLVVLREVFRGRAAAPLPAIGWIGVLLVMMAVFRIAYLALLSEGRLDGEPTTEFIIFEIPTFVFVTIVIIVLALFVSPMDTVHAKASGSTLGRTWKMAAAGIVLLWLVFMIVVVVYTQAILTDAATASPCPGRVPPNNEAVEENTRILSLVYQCVIYSASLMLVCLVLFSSQRLVQKTAGHDGRIAQYVLRILLCVAVPFTARCVLFLVALAIEIESGVYMFVTLFCTEVVMMCALSLFLCNMFVSTMYGSFSRYLRMNSRTMGSRSGSTSSQRQASAMTSATQFNSSVSVDGSL